jgi:hypothetical protein
MRLPSRFPRLVHSEFFADPEVDVRHNSVRDARRWITSIRRKGNGVLTNATRIVMPIVEERLSRNLRSASDWRTPQDRYGRTDSASASAGPAARSHVQVWPIAEAESVRHQRATSRCLDTGLWSSLESWPVELSRNRADHLSSGQRSKPDWLPSGIHEPSRPQCSTARADSAPTCRGHHSYDDDLISDRRSTETLVSAHRWQRDCDYSYLWSETWSRCPVWIPDPRASVLFQDTFG